MMFVHPSEVELTNRAGEKVCPGCYKPLRTHESLSSGEVVCDGVCGAC